METNKVRITLNISLNPLRWPPPSSQQVASLNLCPTHQSREKQERSLPTLRSETCQKKSRLEKIQPSEETIKGSIWSMQNEGGGIGKKWGCEVNKCQHRKDVFCTEFFDIILRTEGHGSLQIIFLFHCIYFSSLYFCFQVCCQSNFLLTTLSQREQKSPPLAGPYGKRC